MRLLGAIAQAQTINLSTNATINVPVIGGPTTVSVPVNVLGNVVNLNVNVTGAAGGREPAAHQRNGARHHQWQHCQSVAQRGGGHYSDCGRTVDRQSSDRHHTADRAVAGVIGSTGSIIANRRNDTLLGLDLGLDRQVDLLTGSGTDATSVWSDPMALGGMRLGEVFNSGSSRDPFNGDQISFAASLQQARQYNAATNLPSGLGAGSRRPPPAKSPFDIWAEGSFARFEDGNEASQREGHWGVLFVGADYRVSPDLLIGALASFDDAQQDLNGLASKARSTGWMVGPYATMRLTNNLFFQARAAWGKSTHELGFDGSPEDRFDADRWLVRGTLIGQWRWGPWQLRPRVSVGYIEELQETYQSSLGVAVPEQKVTLGQVKGGPEISYRHKLADGTVVEPSVLLEGVWNFTQDAGVGAIDDLAFGEDLRARVEAGVMVYLRGGLSVGAAVSYDGIASSDFHAIGGKVRAQRCR